MSEAKKCDSCGKLYEFSDVDRPILQDGGVVVGVRLLVTYHNRPNDKWSADSFDLCDSCSRDIFQTLCSEEDLDIKED